MFSKRRDINVFLGTSLNLHWTLFLIFILCQTGISLHLNLHISQRFGICFKRYLIRFGNVNYPLISHVITLSLTCDTQHFRSRHVSNTCCVYSSLFKLFLASNTSRIDIQMEVPCAFQCRYISTRLQDVTPRRADFIFTALTALKFQYDSCNVNIIKSYIYLCMYYVCVYVSMCVRIYVCTSMYVCICIFSALCQKQYWKQNFIFC